MAAYTNPFIHVKSSNKQLVGLANIVLTCIHCGRIDLIWLYGVMWNRDDYMFMFLVYCE